MSPKYVTFLFKKQAQTRKFTFFFIRTEKVLMHENWEDLDDSDDFCDFLVCENGLKMSNFVSSAGSSA